MRRFLAKAPLALAFGFWILACGDTGDTPFGSGGGNGVLGPGTEGGPCVDGDLCDHGLVCSDGTCVPGTRPPIGGGPASGPDAGFGATTAGGAGAGAAGGHAATGGRRPSTGGAPTSTGGTPSVTGGAGGAASGGVMSGGAGGASGGTPATGGGTTTGGVAATGGTPATGGTGGTDGGFVGADAGPGISCVGLPAINGNCNLAFCLCAATNQCFPFAAASACCDNPSCP